MVTVLRSGKKVAAPAAPARMERKVGRPKTKAPRTCRHCKKTLKTPQGLRKHYARKNRCDKRSVAARAELRKMDRRLASKAYYIRKRDGISLSDWRERMPLTRLQTARRAAAAAAWFEANR
ncbi:hypothetical protein PF002_g32836 [Phytophthora fragariae]|uniref:Uncharacterized protein n=1 Tax=Phytophthora fragariae TaxID=53985 RepID=A0A6A3D922_9STRA|nr:hypothetical protein PF003_g24642 [Phytophthora fragariae]KAE8916683.1 hypothetical protein PF009_g32994 [Phytophthora fragariae]KAE9159548.1 hypothetical protein PF002_g32836 [Phytophthora fragariae]